MSIDKLSPSEKTAIVMLALGEDEAAKLLRTLPTAEAQRVLRALSSMQSVDQELAQAVLDEFTAKVQADQQQLAAGDAFAANLIDRAFSGDEAEALKQATIGTPGLPALEGLEDFAITQVLRAERPQTGALIVAHLDSARAAAVIKPLASELQTEILTRVAKLEPIEATVLEELNEALLAAERAHNRVQSFDRGGPESIAAMLNQMDAATAKQRLDSIQERDPELAAAIEELMFTFHDLIRLTGDDLRLVMQNIPQPQLILAMKTARSGLWQLLEQAMSERAFKLFREDFEAQPKVRRQDVDEAQRLIADQVRAMINTGKIQLQSADEVWV